LAPESWKRFNTQLASASVPEQSTVRLQLRARLRAHTAQQRFSAALLCSLPLVMGASFYFLRYEYISALWLTPQGSRFLIYGIVSEIIGILVIRRIASVRL